MSGTPGRQPGRPAAGVDRLPGTAPTSTPATTSGTRWRSRTGRTFRPGPPADVKVCLEMHPHNIVYNPRPWSGSRPRSVRRTSARRWTRATCSGRESTRSRPWHARRPRLQRRGEGHPHQRGGEGQRRARRPLRPRGGAEPGALPLGGGTRSAAGPRTAPGTSSPSAAATTSSTGPASWPRSRRSTPTWPSPSSTRTRSSTRWRVSARRPDPAGGRRPLVAHPRISCQQLTRL